MLSHWVCRMSDLFPSDENPSERTAVTATSLSLPRSSSVLNPSFYWQDI